MSILYQKAQNGLQMIDTTGYHNRSAVLLDKYKNLNWIKRATDKNAILPSVNNRSHYLGYTQFDEGNYAYPQTVQKEGEDFLTNFDTWREAVDYGKKTKSLIPLGKDKNFADYFTIMGYKQKFPNKSYKEAEKEYSKYYNKRK